MNNFYNEILLKLETAIKDLEIETDFHTTDRSSYTSYS